MPRELGAVTTTARTIEPTGQPVYVTAPVQHTRRAWLPFLVGTAAMLSIGGYKLTSAPLHWDEGATLSAASRSIPEIFRLAQNLDALIAPYYVLMHFWIAVFGDSDLALRLPSLLATSIGVGLVGELGRRLIGPAAGIVAGLLCAILPVLSFHGLQARPYGFVFLFTMLATIALYRAIDRPSWLHWTGYAACLLATGLLQLTSLSVVAAHLAIVALGWYRSRDRRLFRALVSAAAAVVFLLPLLAVGMKQRDTQLNWVQSPTWETWRAVPEDLTLHAPAAYLLVGLALAAAAVMARRIYLELALIVAAPILILLIVSMLGSPVWVARYAMFVLGPLSILAAAPLTAKTSVPVAVRSLVALGLLAGTTSAYHQEIRVSRGATDTKAMAEVIVTNGKPGDGVVFGDYTNRPTLFHYLKRVGARPEQIPRDVLVAQSEVEIGDFNVRSCPDAAACLRGVPRLWLATTNSVDGPAPLERDNPHLAAFKAGYDVAQEWDMGPGRLTLLVAKPVAEGGG
ncbi:glycosyltransferase family 39 protein [Micromonospora zamorensis]|uniref:glycosyltransferase family 39 protein n=1 Tax=Micromonospora zamorensis TaxID=709883 RepID=UPI003CEDE180